MQKADHSGHRDRLRKKYIDFGIEALADHEVLEMLLFNAIPRRNTNDIAKNLIDTFGSISAVFDASMAALIKAGLTQNQAAYVKMIPDVTRLYMLDKYERPISVVDLDHVAEYLADKFIGVEHIEKSVVILVDEKMKEVYCGVIAEGDFGQVEVSTRRIVELCMTYNATGVILAHNHPGGFAVPSVEDMVATRALQKALKAIKVKLLDHFIIADHEAVSLKESGMIRSV